MGTQAPDHVSSLHLAAGEKNLTELCPRFHSQNHHGYDGLNEGQTVFESS